MRVTATLSSTLAYDATIPLSLTHGTAEDGDYGSLSSITIPGGSSSATGTITTSQDADAHDETFTVALDTANLPSYVATGDPSSTGVTVTITDDDAVLPVVSIAAGADVTEGSNATFTVTASPAPASALTVDVTVTQSGGYATAGARQVTVPTGGTATFTVATVDDGADEPDGSVTATLAAGTGYTVSGSRGAATVAVADDDAPLPVVSIAAGAGVTEGGNATFTLTATPAPSTALTVDVTVTQSGGYATAGARQVTVPTGGTATFTVATVDDGADEPDGSVTATLAAARATRSRPRRRRPRWRSPTTTRPCRWCRLPPGRT